MATRFATIPTGVRATSLKRRRPTPPRGPAKYYFAGLHPHPATQRQYPMGGRVGEWAGAAPDSASLNPTLTQLHPAVADRDHIPPGDAGAEADDGAVDPIIGEEGLARKDRRGESARHARDPGGRSEEHKSDLQSPMRNTYHNNITLC